MLNFCFTNNNHGSAHQKRTFVIKHYGTRQGKQRENTTEVLHGYGRADYQAAVRHDADGRPRPQDGADGETDNELRLPAQRRALGQEKSVRPLADKPRKRKKEVGKGKKHMAKMQILFISRKFSRTLRPEQNQVCNKCCQREADPLPPIKERPFDRTDSVEPGRYIEILKFGMARTPCTKRPAVVENGSYTLYKASRSSGKRLVHPVQSVPQ